jgi:hypothetical protein
MLIAGRDWRQLDARDYRVLPDAAEIERPTAILHHYVAESRIGLFRSAWRRVAGARRS